MVVFNTEATPLISIVLLSILLMATFFVIRISISYHFVSTILGRNPNIILAGPPNPGKKRVMEKLKNARVEVKNYPLVGDFEISDISLNNKQFRIVSFESMKDFYTIKKDNVRMIRRRPKLLIFQLIGTVDQKGAELQYDAYREVKRMLFDVPAIAVVDDDQSSKKSIEHLRDVFRGDLVEIHLDREAGIIPLKKRMTQVIFDRKIR